MFISPLYQKLSFLTFYPSWRVCDLSLETYFTDIVERSAQTLIYTFFLRFSVFGLGSRAYPKFCEFARLMDNSFSKLGGERIFPMGEGDELNGQEESFITWARNCFKVSSYMFLIYLFKFV